LSLILGKISVALRVGGRGGVGGDFGGDSRQRHREEGGTGGNLRREEGWTGGNMRFFLRMIQYSTDAHNTHAHSPL
jgi:hypothetical protein